MACNVRVCGRGILENLKPVFSVCWSSCTEGACEKVKGRRDSRKTCFPFALEVDHFRHAPSNLRLDAIGVGGSFQAFSSSWNVVLSLHTTVLLWLSSLVHQAWGPEPFWKKKAKQNKTKTLTDLRPIESCSLCGSDTRLCYPFLIHNTPLP